MRDLAIKTFDIYLSSDPLNLEKAIKKTDVRYVLVEQNVLKEGRYFHYFRPFDQYLKGLTEQRKGKANPFVLLDLERFAIYKEDDIFLIDFQRETANVEAADPS